MAAPAAAAAVNSSIRLREQLLRALVAVVTVPVVVVSAINLRASYQLHWSATEQLLETRAAAIQRRIEAYIQTHTDAIEALAGAVPPGHNLDAAEWQEPLRRYYGIYPGFLTMLVANGQGQVVLALTRNGGQTLLQRGTGDITDRQYFRQAMANRTAYVSGVFLGRGLGHDPLVAISRSFGGSSGGPAGIVQGALNLQRFEQFAADDAATDIAGIMIVDRSNRVTYASPATPFHVLEDLSGLELLRPYSGHLSRFEDFLVGQAENPAAKGWRVLVFASAARLRWMILERIASAVACLLLGIGISVVMAKLVARRITRPLEHLSGRVQTLLADNSGPQGNGAGELQDAPLEVRELAAGFESMAKNLRNSYAALRRLNDVLESRVAERTRDLERINHELALRDRAMAATNEGISIADACQPDNPLVYVNSGFTRLTGYPAEEVLGRNCRFLQGPRTDTPTLARLRAAIAQYQPCTVELLNYRKDGTQFWNRLSITPVQDANGVVTHFVGVQVDITAHKNGANQGRTDRQGETRTADAADEFARLRGTDADA